jgi:uncharacterized protein YeaO (DUF488 family)
MSTVHLKRAYDPPSPEDGLRVLVDRLWPRGLTRDKAGIDLWLKEIAPSTELRRGFGHDKARWPEFRDRYVAEIAANPEPLEKLRALVKENARVTLLYAARDTERNNAVVLHEVLKSQIR